MGNSNHQIPVRIAISPNILVKQYEGKYIENRYDKGPIINTKINIILTIKAKLAIIHHYLVHSPHINHMYLLRRMSSYLHYMESNPQHHRLYQYDSLILRSKH